MKATRLTFGVVSIIATLASCDQGSTNSGGGYGDDGGIGSVASNSDASSDDGSSSGSGSGGGTTSGGSGGAASSSSGSSGAASGSGGSSGGGGGKGSSSGGLDPDASVPINPNAFYVATTGDDNNPGTLASPFATLARAQKAMRGGSNKTTYIRAGTYKPSYTGGDCAWVSSAQSSIDLSSSDNGEAWSFYPPDGYGSAILDGQSSGSGGNGSGCTFGGSGVSNVTIVGLQMQNYQYSGVWVQGSSHLTIQDNIVHDITAVSSNSGGIMLVGSPNSVISNNYLFNIAYMGIVAGLGDYSNTTISSNVVINSCTSPATSSNDTNGGDCGAIYMYNGASSSSTGTKIVNNYVRDVNASSHGQGDFGGCCAQGIYLDDGINNVTSTGNVITGITASCFHNHGGENNVFTGNLCDLGSGSGSIVMYQDDGKTQMTGNVFQDNIVVVNGKPGGGFVDSGAKTPMSIKNNAYFNYGGSSVNSQGAGSDANPTYVDPGLSCWAPTLSSSSPVLAAPVSFPGLQGGWGPPGFTMPQAGTAPSWPHGC